MACWSKTGQVFVAHDMLEQNGASFCRAWRAGVKRGKFLSRMICWNKTRQVFVAHDMRGGKRGAFRARMACAKQNESHFGACMACAGENEAKRKRPLPRPWNFADGRSCLLLLITQQWQADGEADRASLVIIPSDEEAHAPDVGVAEGIAGLDVAMARL